MDNVRDSGKEHTQSQGDKWGKNIEPTAFSENVMDVGPKPFQRPLLMSLSFSSPVFSSTTVVTVDIGFALKLKHRTTIIGET
jgi:hypothetical protein